MGHSATLLPMTRRFALAAWLLSACIALPAMAGEDPPAQFIISTAHQFVAEHFERPVDKRFSISFDITQIHPQPGGDYWAVIGGFAAANSPAGYQRHVFVVAIRLVCPVFENRKCWRLEKLAIDGNILIGRGTRS